MAAAPLSRIDSYQYPAAHLGHLTDSQQNALEKFKEISKDRGYWQPANSEKGIVASHDDETLL